MDVTKFSVTTTSKKKSQKNTINGVLVDTTDSCSIIFDVEVGGKTTHKLSNNNIKNPAKLIASYMVRISTTVGEYSKVVTEDGQEISIDYEMRSEKKPEVTISYKVPNTDVYVPEGTKFTAIVDGKEIVLDISNISTVKKSTPIDNRYTKNEELNKYIAMFGIPYDVFKKYNLAVSFSNFLGKLRNGDVDSIAVPKSTIYVPTSSFYKHNMYKSDSPITRTNSYIRRSSRFDVYEMKKDS